MQIDNKLRNLLENWPEGRVATTTWLKTMSISGQLTQRYLKSGWIESFGHGAYKKHKDVITWFGAIASIQSQLKIKVHVGGPTALGLRGISQYVRMGRERLFLFAALHQKLPKWFINHEWGNEVEFVTTSFLPPEIAVSEKQHQGVALKSSTPERAILECIYLSPQSFDLLECYQLLEGMNTLRPDVMQNLLEECSSIRVKRLFLYMAKKAKLPVGQFLDSSKIDLGKGDRAIVQDGIYISEFKITVPKEMVKYE